MILCDIGNSSYHFLQNNTEFKTSVKEALPNLDSKENIYFLSVNDTASQKFLQAYPQATDIKSYFNFSTQYANTMGLDRQICCYYISNGIIVDCGSAITVDIMKNQKHLGGFILPGFDVLKKMYPSISPKLKFDFENTINLDKIPLNTNDAINYSILKMIILPIQEIQNKYNLSITFTGENSNIIRNHFSDYELNLHLIFDAMKKAIRENI